MPVVQGSDDVMGVIMAEMKAISIELFEVMCETGQVH